jgi:hypothetical protein
MYFYIFPSIHDFNQLFVKVAIVSAENQSAIVALPAILGRN